MALVLPRVGVGDQDGCCAALRGVALLRCQVWGSSQRHAGRSTSLTVPFTALDLLPYRAKPSRGRGNMHTCTVCLTPYCEVLILSWIKHASLKIGYQENIFTEHKCKHFNLKFISQMFPCISGLLCLVPVNGKTNVCV